MRLKKFLFVFVVLVTLFGSHIAFAQDEATQNHVKLSLVPEFSIITPGMPLVIAIKQEIEEGWHTYWRNPGDSGQAPRIEWHLPDGFDVAQLHWPVPHRIFMPPLTNYGYEGEVTLLQEMWASTDLPEGQFEISANIDVLVCKDICIPEYHELTLSLNDGSDSENTELINAAFNDMPLDVNWDAFYSTNEKGQFVIDMAFILPSLVTNGNEDVTFNLIPYEWGIIVNSVSTLSELQKKGIAHVILKKKRGDRPLENLDEIMALVTYKTGGGRYGALEIKAYPDPVWLADMKAAKKKVKNKTEAIEEQSPLPSMNRPRIDLPQIGFAQALLFALLGGIVLNLMPCVFPVLSMKALSLVQMADKCHISARGHGLSYTAGVLMSFGVIAGLLITLQAAGAQIGWGFQMQNPLVVLLLSYLLFMVGLNLSGFYEIKGSFTNVGAGLGKEEGVGESFFTGILSALVATPCTAPFMGVAMGYALTQPAIISLSVFLALGFGLALPYLLLSFFPALRAFLPKPGHWMVTFREFLAFPMYASVVWLVWVYSQQAGDIGLLYALSGFVGISFAVWIFRHTSSAAGTGKLVMRGLAVLVLLTVLSIAIVESVQSRAPGGDKVVSASSFWQPYSAEILATLESGDDPIFINMTAAWCLSCKVNERVSLNTEATKKLFAAHKVQYLKGDWTNQNLEITAFLESYGRNGVPLYIFYGARDETTGKRPDPVILPQLLTPGTIKDMVEK